MKATERHSGVMSARASTDNARQQWMASDNIDPQHRPNQRQVQVSQPRQKGARYSQASTVDMTASSTDTVAAEATSVIVII